VCAAFAIGFARSFSLPHRDLLVVASERNPFAFYVTIFSFAWSATVSLFFLLRDLFFFRAGWAMLRPPPPCLFGLSFFLEGSALKTERTYPVLKHHSAIAFAIKMPSLFFPLAARCCALSTHQEPPPLCRPSAMRRRFFRVEFPRPP